MIYRGISTIDYMVIFCYLFILAGIGLYFSKKVKSSKDFFVANRSLGSFVLLATICSSVIGGSALIGRGGYAYTGGVVSIAIAFPYMTGMFVFSAFSGKISKLGKKYNFSTIPELMEYRFGKSVKIISSILIAYTSIATVGAQISATSTIINVIGGEHVSYLVGAIIATVIFTAYTAGSGLFGVVYTDVIQFVVLIIFVYVMLPIFSINEIGGISEFLNKTSPEKWNLNLNPDIITLIITNFIMTLAGAEFWQRAFAAKNSKSAFNGQFGGTIVYAITIIITMVIGLSAAIMFPNLIQNYGTADYAVPVMIVNILPLGITGLAIAGVLSVMMSSADTYLLLATQSCINDIWKSFNKKVDDKKLLRISRIATIIFALLAFCVAMFIRQAYDALMFGWTFYAATLGVPCLVALTWEKATKKGMLCGMSAGFITSIIWKLENNPFGIGSTIAGVITCSILLVVVSLLTYKKFPSKMVTIE